MGYLNQTIRWNPVSSNKAQPQSVYLLVTGFALGSLRRPSTLSQELTFTEG
ncbi:hypothetical protein HGRIS_009037 [Hohenbuehelia grisea]|uniref:Uncharacterized protein n=1 Tax=Hohenbuehelia grisea TaxID=104357 RepID=A0ABR3J029_9AGAR